MPYPISSKHNPFYSVCSAVYSICRTFAGNLKASVETGQEWRAIAELRAMEDYELADIGLSRSDLTPDGLAVAGAKRKAKQDLGDAHPVVLSVAKNSKD
ncbi:MAG: DUF1127 domain-containing protein [Pseudomonadota bacterium]